MKWLFITILCVNLLYVAWGYMQPEPVQEEIPLGVLGVESVELLSEVSSERKIKIESTPKKNEVVKVVVAEEPKPEPEVVVLMQCYRFGPVKTKADQVELRVLFDQQGVNVLAVDKIKKTPINYWVYMPSLGSIAQARRVVKKLGISGVKDFYIMKAGDFENSISLGVYNDQGTAQRRMNELEKKGYATSLDVRYKETPTYWIDYEIPQNSLQDADFWKKLRTDYAGGSVREQECRK